MNSTDSCITYYFSIPLESLGYLKELKLEFPERFFFEIGSYPPPLVDGLGNRNAHKVCV
jgi:hypothetical protein